MNLPVLPHITLSPAAVTFLILVFAAAATAFQAAFGLVKVGSVKRRVNRRLTVADKVGNLPDLVLELRKKRARKLGDQLPGALEVVVRSLEAGHPVPTAIDLVGKEMPDPIGSEFGMMADEIAFGSTLQQAVGRMSDRCRHPDMDLFAATV